MKEEQWIHGNSTISDGKENKEKKNNEKKQFGCTDAQTAILVGLEGDILFFFSK